MTVKWPADHVERRAIAELLPSARNARIHSDAQIEQLADSIQEWGWTMPVLVDERGEIIAGHGRVLAAQRLKLDQVPVMVARGWSEAQVRAYRIADNRLTENSSWDSAMLTLELNELQTLGFDTDLTGFTQVEAEQLTAPANDPIREYVGMPEYEQNSAEAFRTIMLHFKDAEAVKQFCHLVQQDMSDKTKFLWFPRADRQSYVAQQFKAKKGSDELPPVAELLQANSGGR
jgi:hypothetical protein